jgi:hypothetical protein
MSAPQVHSRATYLRIKAATRELVDLAGGLVRAAAQTRVGQTKLHNSGSTSIGQETVFLSADVIADLERAAGEPALTRELARIAGFELFTLPTPGAGDNWVAMLGTCSQESAAVIGKLAQALGDDGRVTATEVRATKLIALTDDAISALVMLRHAAVAVIDQTEAGRA